MNIGRWKSPAALCGLMTAAMLLVQAALMGAGLSHISGAGEAMALSALMPGVEMDGAFIRVDRQMRTNLPSVFAAGDCTGLPLQVAKAVGEGCIAALAAAQECK